MSRHEHSRPLDPSAWRTLRRGRFSPALLAAAWLVAACGDGGGSTDTGASDAGGGSDAGTGAAGDAGKADSGSSADAGAVEAIDGEVGNFSVRLVQPVAASGSTAATPGNVAVSGKVYDGVPTPTLLWQEASTVGSCTLSKPKAPFCENGCASGSSCVDDGVCQRTPAPRDVGAVTLSGVATTSGASPAKLTNILGSYGPDTGVSFAYPGFAEGDTLAIDAAGAGAIVPFSITAHGVSPLVLTGTSYALERAAPLTLAWDPPGADAGTRISVRLDISHHGGARGLITCDAPDTGSLSIDATLIAGLLDLGVAGYPSIVVSRENVGTTDIGAGRVTLTVYSDVEHAVEIEGLTSCTSNTDCTTGTCQTDLTCK